jgi:hypothetical protein
MMRGLLIALTMLASALIAMPAAAQGIAGLEWLSGKWCASNAQQGTICLTYTPRADGTVESAWATETKSETKPVHSVAVLSLVDGRVTLHSDDQGSTFREVSRAPNELVLESTASNLDDESVRRVSHRREGDVLVLDMELVSGRIVTNRYTRTP